MAALYAMDHPFECEPPHTPASHVSGEKRDRRWRTGGNRLSGLCEAPVVRGYSEGNDRVTRLVGDVQKAAGGIELHGARRLATGRKPSAGAQRAIRVVDGEAPDAVVPAVGDV